MQPYSAEAYGLTGLEHNNYSSPKDEDSSPAGWQGMVHPDNPLFWVGGFLAVAFGLIGLSGGVRVGKARAAVVLDKE